ncbi:LysR family transcriptional regulator [Rhizobium panacihumi]|uniref:LysR family transcriptional regulator n=1 Tax=Rhizobium panacihumi TaxID=2008450 RepID=UPI003D7A22EF
MKSASDISLNISLWDLHVFSTFAETRNLTTCSRQLGVTQSAVSQSIGRLERLFGVTLTDRSHRPLLITRAGDILKARSSSVLGEARRALHDVRAVQTEGLPMLRLGMIDTFATTAGPDVMKSLSRRVENLQMWSGITPMLSAELLNRTVDVIVSNDPMAANSELERVCLLQEPLVAVVPNSEMDRCTTMTLAEICSALPLVRFSARSNLGQTVEYFLSQRRLAPARTMEFDASEAVLRMVSNGLGWAIATPMCLLHAHSSSMDLAALPLPPPVSNRRIYLVYRRNELNSIMPDVIDVFRNAIETTIIPRAAEVTPWVDLTKGLSCNHSTAR